MCRVQVRCLIVLTPYRLIIQPDTPLHPAAFSTQWATTLCVGDPYWSKGSLRGVELVSCLRSKARVEARTGDAGQRAGTCYRSVRHSVDSHHTKVVVWCGLSLRFDVFHSDFIGHVCHCLQPISPMPTGAGPTEAIGLCAMRNSQSSG